MNRLRVSILCLLIVVPAHARQKDSWVGQTVLTKRLGIKYGQIDPTTGPQVSFGTLANIYFKVEAEDGDWVKVRQNGVSGWVDKANVVRLSDAVGYFTEEIRNKPTSDAYNSRASARRLRGELDIAIADFSEAIRLDPKFAAAFSNRGAVWRAKKDYDKAIADDSEAIRLEPKLASAFNNRGAVWADEKDYGKAIADYSEAVRLDPKYVNAFFNRGLAWKAKKEYDKAIADYTVAIRLDPEYVDAFFNRAIAWRAKKDGDKAIADYTEAIRLNPKYVNALFSRGAVWTEKKEYDKAIADYTEAIRLDPKNVFALGNRAWLWATCPDGRYRDGKGAVESATRACVLTEWKDAVAIGILAAACAEAGQFDEAVKYQERALTFTEYGKSSNEKDRERLKLYKEKKPAREP